MKQEEAFHSRLDFPQLPARASWWARVRHQLQLQLLLTFYPHPDSSFYPTRQRVFASAVLAFVGTIVLGYYWRAAKVGVPHYHFYLGSLLLLSLFVLLQLQFRLIPRLKSTLMFPAFLWLCLPVFFFLDYGLIAGARPSLEHLCIMLLLYTNLLHWRAALLGGISALGLSVFVLWIQGLPLHTPTGLEILAIMVAFGGGLLSAYTFAQSDRQRYAQNARIVRLVSKRLHAAFGVQLALSEALRHEAENSMNASSRRRLFEVVERLDLRANLTRAELQEMEKDVGMQAVGSTQLLQISRLFPAVLQELESAYAWPAQRLPQVFHCQENESLVLQGEWLETVQLLASVLALMLRSDGGLAHAGDSAKTQGLHLRWDRDAQSGVRLSIACGEDARVLTVLDAQPEKANVREQWALAERLLPAYSVYILKKMGVTLVFGHFEQGLVQSLRITWPKGELLQNRLTGNRPLSLMQMYGDRWL